jgi:hypothetical protein
MKPRLFSFDIFGTVVDWRRGLEADLTRLGRALAPGDFDRIVDAQGRDEQAEFRPCTSPPPSSGRQCRVVSLSHRVQRGGTSPRMQTMIWM